MSKLIIELRQQVFEYLQQVNNLDLLPKVKRQIQTTEGYSAIETRIVATMVDNNFTIPQALNEIEQTL